MEQLGKTAKNYVESNLTYSRQKNYVLMFDIFVIYISNLCCMACSTLFRPFGKGFCVLFFLKVSLK